MDPILLSALLSFAPSLLSGLFGDPQRKLRGELNRLSSPQYLQNLTAQNYQGQIASPAFSQAQGAIAAGANQTANQVASNLAQRGIGTTGTGAVLSSLTPSLVGSQTAQLRTAAQQSAEQMAQQQVEQRIRALLGTSGPSQSQQLFAGGLEAFLPFLQQLLQRQPNLGQSLMSQYGASLNAQQPLPARR